MVIISLRTVHRFSRFTTLGPEVTVSFLVKNSSHENGMEMQNAAKSDGKDVVDSTDDILVSDRNLVFEIQFGY